jgi:NAD(P)-dependent dehydrogenase (short-subunit alcohol dehydrogenase family)
MATSIPTGRTVDDHLTECQISGSVPVMGIRLDGTVVLVTGGTKGVGRGIAGRFADAGARVAVCARHEPVGGLPDGWRFVPGDLRDPDAAAAAVDAAVEHFGRLDCVVNNAGGSPPADTATASGRFSERIVALNLLAPLYVAQRANHHMQAAGGGTIVNITSVVGLRPAPKAAVYGAAKAGLINLTATLAQEWAPGVRVNAVCCGMVRTEQADLFYGDEDGIARVGATVPLGRLATPEEIGDVAVWLASPLSSYVSGANVVVHGGGDRPPFLDAAG